MIDHIHDFVMLLFFENLNSFNSPFSIPFQVLVSYFIYLIKIGGQSKTFSSISIQNDGKTVIL